MASWPVDGHPAYEASGEGQSPRVDRATFRAADYGRVIGTDGTASRWVRSSNGALMALSHQRVTENDDGTITLVYPC
jgi:hypothetical protein